MTDPTMLRAQAKPAENVKAKAELYYFHPSERCPIDQSIEEITRKLMQTDFGKPIREGLLKFQVINTDDPANAKTVSKFTINAQALYLVTFPGGKEKQNDLTEFAFSTAHSNPGKFKSVLKQDVLDALK
jgi:hypothetical protein